MTPPDLTPELVVWYGLAALLHAATGYLFMTYFTPYAPQFALLGGVLPDLDAIFLILNTDFPFVHRGITHTPVFLIVLLLGLWWLRVREDVLHGIGIGVGLHLTFDTISGWGVMWLWPLTNTRVLLPLHVNGQRHLTLVVTLALTLAILLPPKRRYSEIV